MTDETTDAADATGALEPAKKKLKKKKKKEKALGAPGVALRPSTSAIMRAVDRHYARLFGDPDGSMVFDGGNLDFGVPVPRLLDIPFWTWAPGALLAINDALTRDRPARGRAKGLTRFATVGMSEVPQTDGTRIELLLGIAADLGESEGLRTALTVFLSSVASYPYQYQDPLGRDCFLSQVGEIPGWPGFSGLFLDDLGVDPGEDTVALADGAKVQLLHLVPILPHEVDLVRHGGASALRMRWRETWTDRLDPDRIGR